MRGASTKVAVLIALALLMAIVNASVFTYYPLGINLVPVSPPVIFKEGSNAGQHDLYYGHYGYKIDVTIGENGASATIKLHPTYQTTYYHDVLKITNQDDGAYYVWVYVEEAMEELPGGSEAYLIIGDQYFDLLSTGLSDEYVTLNSGGSLRVDLKFFIPEGSTLPGSSSAAIKLIYSPQNVEKPPT